MLSIATAVLGFASTPHDYGSYGSYDYKHPPPTCSLCTAASDDKDWKDQFGYDCDSWAPDCGAAKLIKKDEDCMDENGAILKGPDDVVCEVGGSGPDTDGYYYS